MYLAEDGDKTIIVTGSFTHYAKVLMSDDNGDNQTLLFASEYSLPLFDGDDYSLSPDGQYFIFQEIYPDFSIKNVKNRLTNTVILDTNSLKTIELFNEKGVEVQNKVIWLENSQSILLQHGYYDWVETEAGLFNLLPVNVGIYLIPLNDLSGDLSKLQPLHSGYSSYILDNDYDNHNNGYIAFMAKNDLDSNVFSVFIFDEQNLTLTEIVKTKGPQSYSIQWIE